MILKSIPLSTTARSIPASCTVVKPNYPSPKTKLSANFVGSGSVAQEAWWQRLEEWQLLADRGNSANLLQNHP
tara:strand:+ start:2837 stop:3055 length:219 start_codon:yes stop_codon:yes gene_type:complete